MSHHVHNFILEALTERPQLPSTAGLVCGDDVSVAMRIVQLNTECMSVRFDLPTFQEGHDNLITDQGKNAAKELVKK